MAEQTFKKNSKVIGLAVICVILAVVMMGALAGYVSNNNSYNTLQADYNNYQSTHSHTNDEYNTAQSASSSLSQVQSDYNAYKQSHTNTNDDFNNLQSNYDSLQSSDSAYQASHSHSNTDYNSISSQLSGANSVIALSNSTVWMNSKVVPQQANTYVSNYFSASYAGYVVVTVQSTTNTQYVEVVYSSHGCNYDNKITVGASGTAVFPILPSSVDIRIGNPNNSLIGQAPTATVTATYYF